MLANGKNKIKRESKWKNKRSEIKLVLLNEEELIQQVCMRPVIYDRSLKGYRKTSLRKQCWNDISKAMDSTEQECRKRWRSLRDSFAKHYKVAQRASETGANKQCKWVFYDQMSFLIPHLDGVSYDFDKILDEFGDISEDAGSLNSEPIVLNTAAEDIVLNDHSLENTKEIKDHTDEQNETLQRSSTVSVQATDFIPILNNHHSPTNINANNNSTTNGTFSRRHQNCCNRNTSTNNMFCGELNGESSVPLDSDEKFLLSCAPTLRRLTHKQNALARLKIQQILYDIEFEQKNN